MERSQTDVIGGNKERKETTTHREGCLCIYNDGRELRKAWNILKCQKNCVIKVGPHTLYIVHRIRNSEDEFHGTEYPTGVGVM